MKLDFRYTKVKPSTDQVDPLKPLVDDLNKKEDGGIIFLRARRALPKSGNWESFITPNIKKLDPNLK